MKIFTPLLVFFVFILTIACAKAVPQKSDTLNSPITEIPSVSNQTVEDKPIPAKQISAVVNVQIENFSTPEQTNQEEILRKENFNSIKPFGLYDLKTHILPKDDVEIRIWQLSDLYMPLYKNLAVKAGIFIFKRKNGNWSAEVFRNTVDAKKFRKQFKIKLNNPKSGWENVWQRLIENELLTFPDSVHGEKEFATDASAYIIETKADKDYKIYENYGSSVERENLHIKNIFNIVSREFDLEDF